MKYIKLFENFSRYLSGDSLIKHLHHLEFDEIINSLPEEVTEEDVKYCNSKLQYVFSDTGIKYWSKKSKRFSKDDINSCITFDLNHNEWFIVFYKYEDEYWVIETYLGEINHYFEGGSDYQYWVVDSYEGIDEWSKMMKKYLVIRNSHYQKVFQNYLMNNNY